MKYGVLVFSYSYFSFFNDRLRRDGHYTVNLGDYMQTLAMRERWSALGVPDQDIVPIDRDCIRDYSGEPVLLPVNACFYRHCFPFPENIIPVFIGFQADAGVISENAAYFKQHEPIGCRDFNTAKLLRERGIAAFVSGCVTLTLPSRDHEPAQDKGNTFLIYGEEAGHLPGELLSSIPPHLLGKAKFISQRKVVHEHPLGQQQMSEAEQYTKFLLATYREQANLVITPLHHAATPCWASGIPTVLARATEDSRFDFISTLQPVYGPSHFKEIAWSALAPNLGSFKQEWNKSFLAQIKHALDRNNLFIEQSPRMKLSENIYQILN